MAQKCVFINHTKDAEGWVWQQLPHAADSAAECWMYLKWLRHTLLWRDSTSALISLTSVGVWLPIILQRVLCLERSKMVKLEPKQETNKDQTYRKEQNGWIVIRLTFSVHLPMPSPAGSLYYLQGFTFPHSSHCSSFVPQDRPVTLLLLHLALCLCNCSKAFYQCLLQTAVLPQHTREKSSLKSSEPVLAENVECRGIAHSVKSPAPQ